MSVFHMKMPYNYHLQSINLWKIRCSQRTSKGGRKAFHSNTIPNNNNKPKDTTITLANLTLQPSNKKKKKKDTEKQKQNSFIDPHNFGRPSGFLQAFGKSKKHTHAVICKYYNNTNFPLIFEKLQMKEKKGNQIKAKNKEMACTRTQTRERATRAKVRNCKEFKSAVSLLTKYSGDKR